MTTEGLSPADVMAMTRNNEYNDWMQNPFIYLVFMWMFRAFNGGYGYDSAATQGAFTRAELYEGLNSRAIEDTLGNIGSAICSGFNNANTTMLQGFNQGNITNLQGFANTNAALNCGFDGVQASLAQLGYNMQSCCCETKSLIKDLAAENYRNTCEITTAIHGEGEQTRKMISENIIQSLRDKLEEKDRDLLSAQNALSQYAQNQYLIGALNPRPVPAYVVANANTGCNCGC